MGKLVKQKHLALYKRYTEDLIDDLSSDVYIHSHTSVECPNCFYDQIHKTSTGKYNGSGAKPFNGGYCPVCGGKGQVETKTENTLKCTVNWVNPNDSDDFVAKTGGIVELIYVKLKTLISHYDTLKNADYIVVDGERVRLVNIIKRGLKENVVCIAHCEKET